MTELESIIERYKRRSEKKLGQNYQSSSPYIYMSRQEKERKLYSLFRALNYDLLSDIQLLEVGCGRGGKLLDLIQMGFSPDNLIGNELMTENIDKARVRLPACVKLLNGDARQLNIEAESLDIVYQSMVFSSILDDNFQVELAQLMWQWVKPGGSILWYDFVFNNPKNADVRGVKVSRVKQLFPDAEHFLCKRVTLAPPISRKVTRVSPHLYSIFNQFPFLRTHALCFIKKPER